jgi:cytoskeletal protein RodZ
MADDHDRPDPAEALMREVGAQLRQVRLERGEELDEVAEHLRIKSTYLFGIEQGDLSRMPGRTYALGFLRSYADYLGFDGDDLIVQIKSTVANLTDRTRLRIRTPLPESRLPKAPILVISLAAIAAIYAGWFYLGRGSQLAVETVAEVPDGLRSMALDGPSDERAPGAPPTPVAGSAPPAPASATLPASPAGPASAADARAAAREEPAPATVSNPADAELPTAAAAGAPTLRSARDPAGLPPVQPEAGSSRPPAANARAPQIAAAPAAPPSATGDIPASAPAAEAAPPSAAAEELVQRAEELRLAADPPAAGGPAPDEDILAALAPAAGRPVASGQIHEPANADARVILRALDDSWVQISSLGGDYLRSRTLQRGDLFLVPNRTDLELWTGNAGGIEVVLDGAVLAPLGEAGAVVREVPLDPPSLRARFGP